MEMRDLNDEFNGYFDYLCMKASWNYHSCVADQAYYQIDREFSLDRLSVNTAHQLVDFADFLFINGGNRFNDA